VVVATDGDGPGHALAEELARRLGRERCWRVKWPQSPVDLPGSAFTSPSSHAQEGGEGKDKKEGAVFRKDANEVL
jgi:hypothetical protein